MLDFADAFMSIGLHHSERRLIDALVYSRAASCIASRSRQAMFDESKLRLQLYVDDPAVSTQGTREERSFETDILLS